MTGNSGLDTFVSFDDETSIELKASYVMDHDLAGVIIWEISDDYVETHPGSGQIAGTPLADTLNGVFCNPVLSTDTYVFSASGGNIRFDLDAGATNANRPYILLGSLHGTETGTPLPGGTGLLPLNWDRLVETIFRNLNGPTFQEFQGTLDSVGIASAHLTCGPIPGAAGSTAHFAYALGAPLDNASNPVEIEIEP